VRWGFISGEKGWTYTAAAACPPIQSARTARQQNARISNVGLQPSNNLEYMRDVAAIFTSPTGISVADAALEPIMT
jgi:hypothetical protein